MTPFVVIRMNVMPGGKQRKMYPTEKIAKGMKIMLEERGISTLEMNGDSMRKELASHPDFKN